jgi:hypothetical protein
MSLWEGFVGRWGAPDQEHMVCSPYFPRHGMLMIRRSIIALRPSESYMSSLVPVTIGLEIEKDEDVSLGLSHKFRSRDAEQCFCEADLDIPNETKSRPKVV